MNVKISVRISKWYILNVSRQVVNTCRVNEIVLSLLTLFFLFIITFCVPAIVGLIQFFKEKIGNTPIDPVDLSICKTYSLTDARNGGWEKWPQPPPDFESMGGVVGNAALGQLGFGAIKDPIKYC